jgi:hypothetical protein
VAVGGYSFNSHNVNRVMNSQAAKGIWIGVFPVVSWCRVYARYPVTMPIILANRTFPNISFTSKVFTREPIRAELTQYPKPLY